MTLTPESPFQTPLAVQGPAQGLGMPHLYFVKHFTVDVVIVYPCSV